jgi:hypothetical protein
MFLLRPMAICAGDSTHGGEAHAISPSKSTRATCMHPYTLSTIHPSSLRNLTFICFINCSVLTIAVCFT